MLILVLHQYYDSEGEKKKQMVQSVDKKYYTNWHLRKIIP